jgi:hypothetical protein
VISLTVGIGKFFGSLLGALFETGMVVIGLLGAAALAIAGVGMGLRRLIGRRR